MAKQTMTPQEKTLDFHICVLYTMCELAHTQFFHMRREMHMPVAFAGKPAAKGIENGYKSFHKYLARENADLQEATGSTADVYLQFMRLLIDHTSNGTELEHAFDLIYKSFPSNHKQIQEIDSIRVRGLAAYDYNLDIEVADRTALFEAYVLRCIAGMIKIQLMRVEEAAQAAHFRIKDELKDGMVRLQRSCQDYFAYYRNTIHSKMDVPAWLSTAMLSCYRVMADRTHRGNEIWKAYNAIKASTKSYWHQEFANDEASVFNDLMSL